MRVKSCSACENFSGDFGVQLIHGSTSRKRRSLHKERDEHDSSQARGINCNRIMEAAAMYRFDVSRPTGNRPEILEKANRYLGISEEHFTLFPRLVYLPVH